MRSVKIAQRQENFFDTCSQCRTRWSCCHETTPPITRKRRQIIENYLKANKIDAKKPFIEAKYVFPRLDKKGYCVFHDRETRRCLIHTVKPETCVAGPITFDINAKTEKIEWFIKMEKICPLAAQVFSGEILLKKHMESAKKELLVLIDELDSGALKAILKRAEPDTFKIGEDSLNAPAKTKLTCQTFKINP